MGRAAAGSSLAVLVLQALPPVQGVGPATWLKLFFAASMVNLLSIASVAGVHTLLQGWQAGRGALRQSMSALLAAMINIAIGLIVLISIATTWWSLLLLAALVAALAFVYRSYAQFFRQHRTLTEHVRADPGDRRDAAETARCPTSCSAGCARCMQAEYATLWLPAQGRHPEVLLTARVDDPGLLDCRQTPAGPAGAGPRRGPHRRRRPRLGDRRRPARRRSRDTGSRTSIVVPLRSGPGGDRHAGGGQPARRHAATSSGPTCRCWRRWPRTRRWPWRTRGWSTGCGFDAYHDALTGLPNRRRITGALDEAVKVRAPGEVVAVLLFDVDGLREVNESLGHAAGDKVLVEVADRLRACAPVGGAGRPGRRRRVRW